MISNNFFFCSYRKQTVMKRKRQEEGCNSCILESKKRRTSSMPLMDSLSLFNLHGLHVVNGPFCLRLKLGLAVMESECDLCEKKDYNNAETNQINQIIKQLEMHKKYDLYKLDVLLQDMWQKSGATKVESCEEEDSKSIRIDFHEVDHISWFAVQLILYNSPVEKFVAEKRKVSICVSRNDRMKKKDEEGKNDLILRHMLVSFHRNVYRLLYSQTFFDDYLHDEKE